MALGYNDSLSWTLQANHIFNHPEINSNYEDYGASRVISLCYFATDSDGECSTPKPECPTYWSLDPFDRNRLSTEAANNLGFPTTQFTAEVLVYYWDAGVYAGLRKFQEGKGFDPDSQDVSLHLGYPLYQLADGSFATIHTPLIFLVDDEISDVTDDVDFILATDDEATDESYLEEFLSVGLLANPKHQATMTWSSREVGG
ncbi:hypothetical protein DFH07DRAFT_779222 [Mycena maculata]|uniref:Uncharacterized protein n=1 Tax=Mycena maculata TaxID=230809 RepID=A0AAD7MYM2_9AGAR|nr:hypothetical protein DFH07DRAFT_779222 [Mycena maculata]